MFAATWDQQGFVAYSSALKSVAIKLSKICNDLRLLSSGPQAGLGEIKLPRDIVRVIVSPGIPDNHALLAAARRKRLEVVSDIELFARDAGAPFVAVTGSNGKSTVTTLIYHIIAQAQAGSRPVPAWLEVIPSQLKILIHSLPARQVIDTQVQEQLIVELYSK